MTDTAGAQPDDAGSIPDARADRTDSGLMGRLLDAHLGSLFAGLVFLFVVLKVLAVTHYDTTSALAVLSQGDTATLLVGAIALNLVPILYAALIITLFLGSRDEVPPATKSRARLVMIVLSVAALMLLPITLGWATALMVYLMLDGPGASKLVGVTSGLSRRNRQWTERLERGRAMARQAEELAAEVGDGTGLQDRTPEEVAALAAHATALKDDLLAHLAESDRAFAISEARRDKSRRTRSRAPKILLAIVVYNVGFALWSLLDDRPWLPAERLVPASGAEITGYVLQADADGMVVLKDDQRRVVRIAGTISRSLCRSGREFTFGRPLIALRYKATSYPNCDAATPKTGPSTTTTGP